MPLPTHQIFLMNSRFGGLRTKGLPVLTYSRSILAKVRGYLIFLCTRGGYRRRRGGGDDWTIKDMNG